MIETKKVLAIIPARAGSKGIPDKNIIELCGKPLIVHTIEASLKSKYLDKIVISTNSTKVMDVASEYDVEVPFKRPENLSDDASSSYAVIEHAIDFYKNILKEEFDYIVMLEPTSPLRDEDDIDKAIEMLNEHSSASALVGISKVEAQHPSFLAYKDEKGFLSSYSDSDIKIIRRQEISNLFFFEGSIYCSKVKALLDKKSFYHNKTIGYEMPKFKSFEIDDYDDLIIIEAFMKKYTK